MCECGCVNFDEYYKFPGPNKTFYILVLRKGCIHCDVPAGVIIEHIKYGGYWYKWYSDKDYYNDKLKFEESSDKDRTLCNIITGMLKSEFINATRDHLVGVNSQYFGENGKIDQDGADAILEEMYEDIQVKPYRLNLDKI